MKIAAACAVMLVFAGCSEAFLPPTSASTPAPACRPTIVRMTPPQQFLDVVVAGSSQPELTREALKTANFYGNDAIWVLLPNDGSTPPTGDKILAYRLKSGKITIVSRRIDGPAPYTDERSGSAPDGYGEIGFQASGVTFTEAGCWEVTYQLGGSEDLTFILLAR